MAHEVPANFGGHNFPETDSHDRSIAAKTKNVKPTLLFRIEMFYLIIVQSTPLGFGYTFLEASFM